MKKKTEEKSCNNCFWFENYEDGIKVCVKHDIWIDNNSKVCRKYQKDKGKIK